MLRINFVACLLVVCLTAGCNAQSKVQKPLDAKLTWQIEVMFRSQFNVPWDYSVHLGAPEPSKFAGFRKLPIVISHSGKSQVVNFLLSNDDKTLVRLDKFDLANDPAFHINIAGRPIRGNPNAKVTFVNFDDLECPFCARLHAELFPSTFDRYKNLVRFVYKDYPLTQLHPWAMHAAVDADCLAAANGTAYWNYVDYLHTHVDKITGPKLDLKKSYAMLDQIARNEATKSKLDGAKMDTLNACIAKQDESEVRASMTEGDALGIQGVPAMFVNGEPIDGAVPEQQIWTVLNRALRAEGETPPPPLPSTAAPAPKAPKAPDAKK